MMIGETRRHNHHVPPWPPEPINPTPIITSSSSSPPSNGPAPPLSPTHYDAVLASLKRYLMLSTRTDEVSPSQADFNGELDIPAGVEDDDDFFMYEFKVRRCARPRAHDWTECPFAHPGEKARRRDPRKYNYAGTACSEFRKGNCKKGDNCEFAHGVFECWLHPARFRTQACKDGPGCKRRVCFFAHSPDQIRDGSGLNSPKSPGTGLGSVDELGASLIRNMQLSKVNSMPSSWKVQIGSPVFGSPRGSVGSVWPGFLSLPTTPTTRPGIGLYDAWDECGEEPKMERVESGRELRARMFAKLSKENPLSGPDLVKASGSDPDLGWVSDLIK